MRDKTDLSEDLDLLLRDLCIQWGFCNRLTGEALISQTGQLTASSFAVAVLAAEGMNPGHQRKWLLKIEAKFIEHFGQSGLEFPPPA
jgi:hypothetical protein